MSTIYLLSFIVYIFHCYFFYFIFFFVSCIYIQALSLSLNEDEINILRYKNYLKK